MPKFTALIFGFVIALATPIVSFLLYQSHRSASSDLIQNLSLSALKLESRLRSLQDIDELKNLQNVYGYYFERSQWDEVTGLFSLRGSFEQAQDGRYLGRQHIYENLNSYKNTEDKVGELKNLIQMQPIIHLDSSNLSASMRVREFSQEGTYSEEGFWSEGVYENRYIKEEGVWKIDTLHLYLTLKAPYKEGWGNASVPVELWRASDNAKPPSDLPPSELYRSYPDINIAPFHYANPVTGRLGLGMGTRK